MGKEEMKNFKEFMTEIDSWRSFFSKHTENYLMLAKLFGTKDEVAKVKEIIKRSKKTGEVSEKDKDWMYKNINKWNKKM